MSKTQTTPTAWRILDTYEAEFLNETPPRRETVSEIQAEETGETLCYTTPENAELIRRMAGSFEALREACGDAEKGFDMIADLLADNGHDLRANQCADMATELRTALALSEGRQP
jgi:hypothetical protein